MLFPTAKFANCFVPPASGAKMLKVAKQRLRFGQVHKGYYRLIARRPPRSQEKSDPLCNAKFGLYRPGVNAKTHACHGFMSRNKPRPVRSSPFQSYSAAES